MLLAAFTPPPLNEFEAALATLDSLPAKLAAVRVAKTLTPKAQAAAIGITAATLTRYQQPGSKPTSATERAVLRYLGGLNG